MSEQTLSFGLIPELFRLGEAAKQYYWEIPQNDDERRKKEKALNEFVDFFKTVPQAVAESPHLAKDNLGAHLMRIGITFGRLDGEAQIYNALGRLVSRARGEMKILMTAGQVLSQLGEQHENIKDPALRFLKGKIKSGWRWTKHYQPEAYMEREDALEIIGWAVVGTPDWINPDLTNLAAEAALLPYCMDAVMIDNIIFDLKKNNPVLPEEIASIYSEKACETLGTMMRLNPDLAETAYDFVERAENRAEKMCQDELFPVIALAAEQAYDAIFEATKDALIPGDVVKNILALSPPDDLTL